MGWTIAVAVAVLQRDLHRAARVRRQGSLATCVRRLVPDRRRRRAARAVPRLPARSSGMLKDIRRVFQYHGAEHKAIAAYENDVELTPESAQQFTTAHVRCGTNFLLTVMVVAIFVYSFIPRPTSSFVIASRIVLMPLIAGLSYEVIRFAAKNMHRALGARADAAGPVAPAAHDPRARPRPARGGDRVAAGGAHRRAARRGRGRGRSACARFLYSAPRTRLVSPPRAYRSYGRTVRWGVQRGYDGAGPDANASVACDRRRSARGRDVAPLSSLPALGESLDSNGSLAVRQVTAGAVGGPFAVRAHRWRRGAARRTRRRDDGRRQRLSRRCGSRRRPRAGAVHGASGSGAVAAEPVGGYWEFTGVECDGATATVDAPTATATLTLDAGAAATCTVTDTWIADAETASPTTAPASDDQLSAPPAPGRSVSLRLKPVQPRPRSECSRVAFAPVRRRRDLWLVPRSRRTH